ncbi:MAG TPA: tyrosinase family protein [Thermoanaerobaculia bacterium]|nr:tyrosinase family protein [Thermoanaerobaculia bacterium]
MSISRRVFMRHVVTAGPVAMAFWVEKDLAWAAECGLPATDADCTLPTAQTPTRFIPNEPKVLTRFSAHEMADPSRATQLQQYRDAICKVRDLPKTDVISWTKQIAQHCIHCAQTNPSNIHFDWQFLPWHRAYLYFLERILRKLGGHDDLRLNYWNWEDAASRTLPTIYAPANQPLFWKNRGNLSGPNWPLSNTKVDVSGLLATPTFKVFGGTATQGAPTPASFSGPHANVHNNFAPGDMADLQFSPRDPVFYSHHGNIDRLWSSWVAASSTHKNPDFGTAKVMFYDENRQWRYILLNDLRDETKLGYKYSSLMKPKVQLSALKSFSLAKTANRITLGAQLTGQAKANKPQFLILQNVHNLEKLGAKTVAYGIFSGKPPVGTDSEKAESFLGLVSRVLSSGHEHNGPLSAAFDVTGKLGALAGESQGALDLSVAPLDAAGKTTAESIPLSADDVSIVG